MLKNYLDITPEVQEAIAANKPVVALESTIITHGMPYPQNVETAKSVEKIVRDNGAIPATIALMDGKIKVGLSEEDLDVLAAAKDCVKVSRRDLAMVLSKKQFGGTTVATTMMAAHMAGIKFFVTGGIGGVHRGYEETMDVSADLEELATTDVTVICAGAKAILDLPRTMEYLETKGVPVVGYQTLKLPAFYTRTSDIDLRLSVDTPEEFAQMLKVKTELNLKGGVLVANPIPEEDSIPEDVIGKYIDDAIADSKRDGIVGKDMTPYLLQALFEKTAGKSLEANMALVFNNAKVGSQLAVAYAKLQ